MKNTLAILALTLLTACGEVIAERTSTVDYMGETFQVRTQTLQMGDRVYDVSRVRAGAVTATCIVDSPGSCEAAAAEASQPMGGSNS